MNGHTQQTETERERLMRKHYEFLERRKWCDMDCQGTALFTVYEDGIRIARVCHQHAEEMKSLGLEVKPIDNTTAAT
jgi:hypothetical protein